MNWILRLGQWIEYRKVMRKPEIEKFFSEIRSEIESMDAMIKVELNNMRSDQKVPAGVARELALLNARLNQLELFVGLKRDPKPSHVPGAAKIS